MKFKYTGDKSAVNFRGVIFAKGEAVSVSEEMAYRLIDKPNFAEVKPEPKKTKKKAAE